MRFDLKELLKEADRRKYAIPAFNFSDTWELKAIVEAADEMNAPVIAASNMQIANTWGAELLGSICGCYTRQARTPIVFHLDHSKETKLCKSLLDNGYTSVMFDGSALPLDENIAGTKDVVKYAQSIGACVEAEIGHIKGNNEESNTQDEEDFLASTADAVRMVEESGCDSLAIGIGNAHGFYREDPKLHFERLAEINAAVSVPLVLHGGTGIPESDIQKAIQNGINKVNVGTELHFTYLNALQKLLSEGIGKPNIVNFMEPVVESIKAPVKKWIQICMAENKA